MASHFKVKSIYNHVDKEEVHRVQSQISDGDDFGHLTEDLHWNKNIRVPEIEDH